ncbi:MAG: biotin-dependent carboxyltransferase family protein, partial [Chthoniobacterales bacterium]
LMTVQDLGRLRHRHEGIAQGGALDLHAARVANLLVGNVEESALIEITLGPARLGFSDERIIACCGADSGISLGKPLRVRPNEELELRVPSSGCRSWIAVSGGIAVPPVLGSRATDLRGHFGGLEGRALQDGDELPLGKPERQLSFSGRSAPWSAPNEWVRTAGQHPVLRIVPGSEWKDFTPAARSAFLQNAYVVSQKADRMGARLEGAELARTRETELISEAVVPGTIQIANDRQPILLLGDCQTIGGYPKIAHVITVDLPLAAQLRPNDRVRFEVVSREEAYALYRARAADLERFRIGLRLRFS